jgi:sugar transferase (PEP-CTERM/EpsH1 system associated)
MTRPEPGLAVGAILFLASCVPFPPDRADRIRAFHQLEALAKLAPVHLYAFADDAADAAEAETLRPLVASLHVERKRRSRAAAGLAALSSGRPLAFAAFDSVAMHAAIARRMAEGGIATIFAVSVAMAPFVPEASPCRVVLDFREVESVRAAAWTARAAGPTRWIQAREARLLLAQERAAAAWADTSLFASEPEAASFRERADARAIAVLENGVALDYFDPLADFARLGPGDRGAGPLIVFTGQMDRSANVEAVESFADGSFPAILRRHPTARFAIVGRAPDPAVTRLGRRPQILVTGAVADVRGWLAAADVVVAPMRQPCGVANKVLEAMAMVRPVVASPAAVAGIAATAGVHLLVADAEGEADAVASLLGDRGKARAIAVAGRARVEARYAWEGRLTSLPHLVGLAPGEPADSVAEAAEPPAPGALAGPAAALPAPPSDTDT